MAMNGITSGNSINISTVSASYESVTVSASVSKSKSVESTAVSATATSAATESAAAVFEKSEESVSNAAKGNVSAKHKVDKETLDKLKADADARNAQLKGLVEKLLAKQGKTFEIAKLGGLANVYKGLEVDEETRKQAEEDISEDGYWGVEATSDRIVDFAKALAGDNLELAQKMVDAVKEGFKQAGKEWGEELPDISHKTMDATYSKLNDWVKSLGGGDETSQSSTTTVNYTATYTKVSVSASSFSANVSSTDITE